MTPPSVSVPAAPLLAAAVLILGACGSPTHGRQMTFPASSAPRPPHHHGAARPRRPAGPRPGHRTGHWCCRPGTDSAAVPWPRARVRAPAVRRPAARGWDWATAQPQDQIVVGGRVARSGTYAVTGRFDGRALTVTGSVPLGLYDIEAEPSPRPSAPPDLDAAQWEAVMRGLDATARARSSSARRGTPVRCG